jgi:hypothetical protein
VSVPIEEVQVGDEVLSLNRDADRLMYCAVSKVLDQGRKECVELVFADGRVVTVTEDHLMLTAERKWVAAGELEVGQAEVSAGVEHPLSTRAENAANCVTWSLDTAARLGSLNMCDRRSESMAFA